eukprot:scaffold7599_cov417-Prasinococcus_capsulatus_cf.AAC.3
MYAACVGKKATESNPDCGTLSKSSEGYLLRTSRLWYAMAVTRTRRWVLTSLGRVPVLLYSRWNEGALSVSGHDSTTSLQVRGLLALAPTAT